MKKILLYFFLFTYALVVFKPYAPYFTDAVAHVLFFKDHMETVHAHNGKTHVHAEVNQLAKSENSEKSSNIIKKLSVESDHISFKTFQFLQNKVLTDWHGPLFVSDKNMFADITLPPPKA